MKTFQDFTHHSYLAGLKELFLPDANNILRIVWLMFMLFCSAVTVVQIYQVTAKYVTEPTTTSVVSVQGEPLNEFQNLTMCVNASYINEVGLNPLSNRPEAHVAVLRGFLEPSCDYTAKYITWLNLSAGTWNINSVLNWDSFSKIPIASNLLQNQLDIPTVAYEWLDHATRSIGLTAINQSAMSIYAWTRKTTKLSVSGILDPEAICISARLNQRFSETYVMNFFVPLHPRSFPSTDLEHFYYDGLFYTHYSSIMLYDEDEYYQMAIPDQIKKDSKDLIFYKEIDYSLDTAKFVYSNLKRKPCVDPGVLQIPAGKAPKVCQTACVNRKLEERYNCRFALTVDIFTNANSKNKSSQPYCHWFNIFQQLRNELVSFCTSAPGGTSVCRQRSISDWSMGIAQIHFDWLFDNISRLCANQCKDFLYCTEWSFSQRVLNELPFLFTKSSYSNLATPSEFARSLPGSFYLNAFVGVSKPYVYWSYNEELIYSLEGFVGVVGGIGSFYFSMSTVSVFHILFFCIYRCNCKMNSKANKVVNIKLDSPSPFGGTVADEKNAPSSKRKEIRKCTAIATS